VVKCYTLILFDPLNPLICTLRGREPWHAAC
jgi:hypothetical protein